MPYRPLPRLLHQPAAERRSAEGRRGGCPLPGPGLMMTERLRLGLDALACPRPCPRPSRTSLAGGKDASRLGEGNLFPFGVFPGPTLVAIRPVEPPAAPQARDPAVW